MIFRRAMLALLLVQWVAFPAAAQQAAEYGRATGGELVLTPKGAAPFSGSLELSLSNGRDVFGRGNAPAYGLTAGGTLLQDRLWFFASASRQNTFVSRYAAAELPENATSRSIGARVDGQLGASRDFSASFSSARRPELTTFGTTSFATVPTSFLSLRYTGIVSSNMYFTMSATSTARTAPQ